jgi:hypothetical protein
MLEGVIGGTECSASEKGRDRSEIIAFELTLSNQVDHHIQRGQDIGQEHLLLL